MDSLKMRLIFGAVLVIFMSIHMGTTLKCYSCQKCSNGSQISNVTDCLSNQTACFNFTNTENGNLTLSYGCGFPTKCDSLSGVINGSCATCNTSNCNYFSASASGNNSNSSGSSNSTNNGHNSAGPLVRNSNIFLGIAAIIVAAFMTNTFNA